MTNSSMLTKVFLAVFLLLQLVTFTVTDVEGLKLTRGGGDSGKIRLATGAVSNASTPSTSPSKSSPRLVTRFLNGSRSGAVQASDVPVRPARQAASSGSAAAASSGSAAAASSGSTAAASSGSAAAASSGSAAAASSGSAAADASAEIPGDVRFTFRQNAKAVVLRSRATTPLATQLSMATVQEASTVTSGAAITSDDSKEDTAARPKFVRRIARKAGTGLLSGLGATTFLLYWPLIIAVCGFLMFLGCKVIINSDNAGEQIGGFALIGSGAGVFAWCVKDAERVR